MSLLCRFSAEINIDYDLSFDFVKAKTFSLLLLGLFPTPFLICHLLLTISLLQLELFLAMCFPLLLFSLCEFLSLANEFKSHVLSLTSRTHLTQSLGLLDYNMGSLMEGKD